MLLCVVFFYLHLVGVKFYSKFHTRGFISEIKLRIFSSFTIKNLKSTRKYQNFFCAAIQQVKFSLSINQYNVQFQRKMFYHCRYYIVLFSTRYCIYCLVCWCGACPLVFAFSLHCQTLPVQWTQIPHLSEQCTETGGRRQGITVSDAIRSVLILKFNRVWTVADLWET